MSRSDGSDDRRVVVTGLGMVSALGADVRTSWRRLIEGESGIGPVTLFPVDAFRSRVAAELTEGFDPEVSRRELRRMARTDRAAVRAALEAAADAELDPADLDPDRGSVVLGAGAAGLFEAEGYFRDRLTTGGGRLSQTLSYFPSSATDWVASVLGLGGFRSTVVTACSSSALAIGQAYDVIRRGRADVAMAGGSDTLSRLTFAGFNALRATDVEACRPFDRERAGLSLGEGAAMMVLESRARARGRGARIYAEILGYGVRCDAHHMTAPEPNGDGAHRTMQDALRMARVSREEIGYISAHGTATPLNDKAETLAIRRVLGEEVARRVWVSSIKGAVGHCLGSAGAMEAVALALTLHEEVVPPTLRYESRDPECDLDYVPNEARRRRIEVGLSNSFAFGGNNATLVMGRDHG